MAEWNMFSLINQTLCFGWTRLEIMLMGTKEITTYDCGTFFQYLSCPRPSPNLCIVESNNWQAQ